MAGHFLKVLHHVCVFLLLGKFVWCTKSASTRRIILQHNPGCDIPECNRTSNSSTHLIYAKAQGSNDSLHYVFSTVGPSPPTLLLLRSADVYATLNVNWTQLCRAELTNLTGAIKLVSEDGKTPVIPDIESILLFDRVLEYNDSSDDSQYNASLAFSPILLRQLEWNVTSSSPSSFLMTGSTTQYPESFSNESSISFNVSLFGTVGEASLLPSLPHNENSSDWDFVLDNLLTRGNGSRFLVKLAALEYNSSLSMSRQKTIDDEYSPAVFLTEKVEWSESNTSSVETFSQWRAVSYTTSDHQRKYSTDVATTDLKWVNESTDFYRKDILQNHLLCAYFGSERVARMNARFLTVSFGQAEDGFFAATNYLSWTYSIGFGNPPSDRFSMMVICMLLAGIGCPLLVIVIGGFYVLALRIKRKRRSSVQSGKKGLYGYQPIQ